MANWHFEPMSGRGIRYIIDNIDNIEKTLKKSRGYCNKYSKRPRSQLRGDRNTWDP